MDLQGGPTFEDLSIDDELSPLERVVRYSSSSIALQRLVHVKMLAETVAAVGFEETIKSIVPLLGPLAADQELVVREHLGEQMFEIARLCRSLGREAGYRLIIETVLPTLTKLLGDNAAAVKQAAGKSLVGVAGLMKPLDLGQHVLTIVLQLAHDDEEVELRMTAAALLNDLAESLGSDLCKQFVTPEMVSLSEDPVFRVRKATALNLHKICKVVGEAGIQRLLPAYIRLTKDDVYRVRKACTEALVDMSKSIGPEVSLRELTPVFINLASDSSKLVRTGALQQLGRLISTLPGEAVTEELVGYFTATAVETMGDPMVDAELRLYCAYSFPAVVITIGPDRWKELRDSFAALLRDPSWSVRKTLSHSLHEVAKVLKEEDVETDLVPAMEAFLRDMEDLAERGVADATYARSEWLTGLREGKQLWEQVRLGVIKHLADFFEQMSPPRREKHLNILVEMAVSAFNKNSQNLVYQDFFNDLGNLFSNVLESLLSKAVLEILQTTSPFNWRLREVLAQQLANLAPLLTLDSVFFAVVPVAFGLLNDPVAVVRERTFEVVAPLLELAGAHSSARQASMVSRVRELAHAHTYQARQMYVYICHSMACVGSPQVRPLFIKEFIPSLAELARDSVVNVRIAMSRTLSKCPDWVMELPEIRRAIHHLVRDSNRDVRHFVSFLPPILGHDLSQEDKVLWVDTSSVLSDESVLTQWSVSTQRSMLSVVDFPHVKDPSSPNRSFKLGRERSSSVESAGESNNSTTSSEGDALNCLRRPPLPAGWGLGSASTAPTMTAFGGGGGMGAKPDEPTTISVNNDGAAVAGAGNDTAVAWNGGDGHSGDGVSAENKDSPGPKNGDEIGEGERNVVVSMSPTISGGAALAEALPDGDAAVQKDGDISVAKSVSSVPGRNEVGTEETAAGAEDEGDNEKGTVIVSPIIVVPPVDSAALSSKMEALTLGEEAGIIPEVNREGMLPPTPLPNPIPLQGDLRSSPFDLDLAGRKSIPGGTGAGPGSGPPRPFEEHAPVWTGDEDDDEDVVAEDFRGAGGVVVSADAAVLDVGKEQDEARTRTNHTPPPWEGSVAEQATLAGGKEHNDDEHGSSAAEAIANCVEFVPPSHSAGLRDPSKEIDQDEENAGRTSAGKEDDRDLLDGSMIATEAKEDAGLDQDEKTGPVETVDAVEVAEQEHDPHGEGALLRREDGPGEASGGVPVVAETPDSERVSTAGSEVSTANDKDSGNSGSTSFPEEQESWPEGEGESSDKQGNAVSDCSGVWEESGELRMAMAKAPPTEVTGEGTERPPEEAMGEKGVRDGLDETKLASPLTLETGERGGILPRT